MVVSHGVPLSAVIDSPPMASEEGSWLAPTYLCTSCGRTALGRVAYAAGVSFGVMPDGWVVFMYRRSRLHVCGQACLDAWRAQDGPDREVSTDG